MLGRVLGVAGIAVGAVVVACFVVLFVAGHLYAVPSASMEPTLHCAKPQTGCQGSEKDRVVALKWLGVGRGDIVAFRVTAAACGVAGTYVKRVIGVPGDTVRERDGVVFVNGKRLAEPYLSDSRRDAQPAHSWHVPGGAYFVLGDNRSESCDSRVFGPVSKGDVTGKVVFRYWPLSRLGSL